MKMKRKKLSLRKKKRKRMKSSPTIRSNQNKTLSSQALEKSRIKINMLLQVGNNRRRK